MKLTHAMLIAGMMTSISGSIGLLTSGMISATASSGEPSALQWEQVDRTGAAADGGSPVVDAPDQAVVVQLARLLHRSETVELASR